MTWQVNALHFGTLVVAPSEANHTSHLSDKKASLGCHRRIQTQEIDVFQDLFW